MRARAEDYHCTRNNCVQLAPITLCGVLGWCEGRKVIRIAIPISQTTYIARGQTDQTTPTVFTKEKKKERKEEKGNVSPTSHSLPLSLPSVFFTATSKWGHKSIILLLIYYVRMHTRSVPVDPTRCKEGKGYTS